MHEMALLYIRYIITGFGYADFYTRGYPKHDRMMLHRGRSTAQEWMEVKRMGRPAINAKKTTLSVRTGLDGWLEFMGRDAGGASAYLNDLAARDRERVVVAGGALADRYLMYLAATGREDERAAALEATGLSGLASGETLAGMTRGEWAALTLEDAATRAAEGGVPLDVVTTWAVGQA